MVDGDQYIERVSSVMKQFEMARTALLEFRDNPAKQESVAHDAVSSFLKTMRKMFAKAKDFEIERAPEWPCQPLSENVVYGIHSEHEHVRNQLRQIGDEAREAFVGKVDISLNRVNQNELILLVALFESQMTKSPIIKR
jgi:hypothetical protein